MCPFLVGRDSGLYHTRMEAIFLNLLETSRQSRLPTAPFIADTNMSCVSQAFYSVYRIASVHTPVVTWKEALEML